MQTLEDRNLNRLRNGKMMLEFADRKKSHTLAFVLAIFFAGFGAHRFYLGQRHAGAVLLTLTIISMVGIWAINERFSTPLLSLIGIYWIWLIIEIILSPYHTSRVNREIKAQLAQKYGVEDYAVK